MHRTLLLACFATWQTGAAPAPGVEFGGLHAELDHEWDVLLASHGERYQPLGGRWLSEMSYSYSYSYIELGYSYDLFDDAGRSSDDGDVSCSVYELVMFDAYGDGWSGQVRQSLIRLCLCLSRHPSLLAHAPPISSPSDSLSSSTSPPTHRHIVPSANLRGTVGRFSQSRTPRTARSCSPARSAPATAPR